MVGQTIVSSPTTQTSLAELPQTPQRAPAVPLATLDHAPRATGLLPFQANDIEVT